MASSKTRTVTSGAYTHTMRAWIVSQDPIANTSRVGYKYSITRLTDRTTGAWTTLNSVDFTTVVNGNSRTVSPNFDFRDAETITFLSGEYTVAHTSDGTKSINFSFDCTGLDPSPYLLPASGSSTLVIDPITRASTFVSVRPNPANEESVVTIVIDLADPSFTHELSWETETTSGTIGTVTGDTDTWTVPPGFLGAEESVPTTLILETYDGATLLGTETFDMTVREPRELPTVGAGTPYDFRFRRTELDGGVWVKAEIIPTLAQSFTDTYSATATCDLTVVPAMYDAELDNTAVALEIFDGANWLDFDLRFLLTRVQSDESEDAETRKYTGTQFLDFILGKGQTASEHKFENVTPGKVMKTMFDGGQGRGWGPYVDYDFSETKTSLGTNWANTKVDLDVSLDTAFLQLLDGLVQDAVAEYRVVQADGKSVLQLLNPGTGLDWAVEGADPIVNLGLGALNRVADKAPIRKDYGNMLTRVRVRGDEVSRTRESAASLNPLLGHLEGSVNASDVKTKDRLDKLGDVALTNQGRPDVERTFSYDLSSNQTPTQLYPYRVFRPGDWVLMPGDSGPERIRVAQIALSRDGDTVTATVTGGDLIPSAIAAQARKMTQQNSGAIAGGTLRSPDPLAAGIPMDPDSLIATPDGYWSPSGAPRASVALSWQPVTSSLEGSDLDVDLYEIWTRPEIGNPWVTAGISSDTDFVVDPLDINATMDFRVRARSTSGVYGQFSDLVTVTTPEPDETLGAPSNPVLASDAIGTVAVTWNGLIDGVAPPLWFAYLQAEISSTEVGGYTVAGSQLTSAGTITVPNVGNGTWWFRLTPYDTLGNAGTSSAGVSTVVAVVIGDDRVPKAPTSVTAVSSGYWTGSSAQADLLTEWAAVTEATDDSPMDIVLYEVWGRLDADTNPHLLTAATALEALYAPIGPLGSTWQVSVRAMGSNNIWSALSAETEVTIDTPALTLDPPTSPSVTSWQGLLLVAWDGNLLGLDEFSEPFSYAAPAYLAHVDVFVSVDDGATYERVGFLNAGDRTQSVSGLAVGDSVRVRLVAVDRLGQATTASEYETVTVVGIDGADIIANSITGNRISAGTIEVSNLSPSVGTDLDISANGTVSIIAGDVASVQADLDTTSGDLAAMRTRYDFTPSEALISQPGSVFQVAISNTQLEFRESGVARAYLNAGVFTAPQMASGNLVLNSHVIADDTQGTVIRRVS